MADEAGLDFMLPIGRWKGYGGRSDYQGATLETVAWACGLLAKTRRITVFGTVHVQLLHPIIAAKAFVTADHIGEGRFGLNVVCGWNEGEFEMFGVDLAEHETRYDYAQEWLDAVRMAWSHAEPFDFDGRFITLKGVRAEPKPWGGTRPMLMNAGISATGEAFAIRNCEALFLSMRTAIIEDAAPNVAAIAARAAAAERNVQVFTVGLVTCRTTRAEAEAYHRHCIYENADWEAVDTILAMRKITPDSVGAEAFARMRGEFAFGHGGFPMVGDPDDVATMLARISAAGFGGVGLAFVNYADELPFFCAEVLPRLERLGLRTPLPG
jgi:alkanesulfonate monooxygenase SsuD/methylene tetrahydromethanopterin reductase-like flavin-dependent oxidoreductase (luciferase family)